MKKISNVCMKEYTTYKTGGNVKTMYFPENREELIELLKYLKTKKIKYFIIGNGSNLIIDDNDFDGAIINLKKMNDYEIKDNTIYLECGVMVPYIANVLINKSFKCLEWAISIPGTIGGSIYNNAGAYNSSFSDILLSVDVLDENYNIITLSNRDCEFSYRDSIFKKEKKYLILSCLLKTEYYDKEELIRIVNDRKERRLLSQPLEYPSAGSVFRNPMDIPAGKLIDDLNLKGFKIGGASISMKHANFIINEGTATSNDIKNLISLIHDKVLENYGIDLHLEQEIINWE